MEIFEETHRGKKGKHRVKNHKNIKGNQQGSGGVIVRSKRHRKVLGTEWVSGMLNGYDSWSENVGKFIWSIC